MSSSVRAFIAALTLPFLTLPTSAEPAIWTLSDDDTVINIIGTIHVLPEGTVWRGPRITAAFDAADEVCFEIDIAARALEALSLSYSLGVMKDGDRLLNHLNEEDARDLRDLAGELGIPFESLNVMNPWFASMTIEQYIVDRLGFGEGAEMSLYPDIEAQGKAICEMETTQEQLGAIAGMSFEDQLAAMLYEPEEAKQLDTTEQLAYAARELNQLVEDWLEGDVAAISKIIDREAGNNPAFHEALLVSRNKNWVPRIESLLEQQGNFLIAVGAAHLAGHDSVIKMLRDKGYKIEGP